MGLTTDLAPGLVATVGFFTTLLVGFLAVTTVFALVWAFAENPMKEIKAMVNNLFIKIKFKVEI